MGRGEGRGKGIYLVNEDGSKGNRVGTIGVNISREQLNKAIAGQQKAKKTTSSLLRMRFNRQKQTMTSGPTVMAENGATPAYLRGAASASPKQRKNAENALMSQIEYLSNNAGRTGLIIDPVGLKKDMNRFINAVKGGNNKVANNIASKYMSAIAMAENATQRKQTIELLGRMSDLRKAYK